MSKYKKNTSIVFYRKIRKYGFENFKWEIIDTANNINCLNKKEEYYIKKYNSIFPNGYNLLPGGNNKKMNERTKKILSEKAKLRMNEESRKKFISDMQKTKIKLGLNKICKKGKEHPNTKTILQVCRDTGKILNIFESSYLAQEKTKVNQSDIIKNCNKKIFQVGGYFWFYKEEYNKSSFEEAKNNFLNRHNYCSIKIKIINELNEELIFLSIKKASKYLNVSDTYLISLIKLNGNNFFKKIKNKK